MKKYFFAVTLLGLMVIVLGTGARVASSQEAALVPEKALSEAVVAMAEATGVSFDIKATFNLSKLTSDQKDELSDEFQTKIPGSLVLITKGAYDESNPNSPKLTMKNSITAGALKAAFDLRLVNNMMYGQLTKAPKIELLPFLKDAQKKWVSFPDFEVPEDSLTPAQRTHVTTLTRNARLVKVTDTSSQKVGSVDAHVISFDLDRAGIVAYINAVNNYFTSIEHPDNTFGTGLTLEELNLVKDFKGKVWIGKKDNLPYKFSMDFIFIPDEGEVKAKLTGTFKNWNKSVNVMIPSNATPFEELVEGIMEDAMNDPDLFSEVQSTANDARAKAVVSGLRAEAELFYDNDDSYEGFCNDLNPRSVEIVCKDTDDYYAVLTTLSTKENFCADSSGFAGLVGKKTISSNKCPR